MRYNELLKRQHLHDFHDVRGHGFGVRPPRRRRVGCFDFSTDLSFFFLSLNLSIIFLFLAHNLVLVLLGEVSWAFKKKQCSKRFSEVNF